MTALKGWRMTNVNLEEKSENIILLKLFLSSVYPLAILLLKSFYEKSHKIV